MKIVLFDFDGVIVDTFSFCYRIINARDSITEDEYRKKFEENINRSLNVPAQDATAAKHFDFFGQYTPELMGCQPNQEIAQVIKALAQNHTLIIISSTISASIEKYLEANGLRDAFKEILGNDVEKSKVKKIQSVLQRYGVQPSDTIFITDTLGDIKEAKECDVRSIAVTWGFHPTETLQKGQPYKIVSRPREILEVIRMDAC